MSRPKVCLSIALALLLRSADSWGAANLVFGNDVTAQNCPADVTLTLSGTTAPVGGLQADLLYPSPGFAPVNAQSPCTLGAGLPGAVYTADTNSPPPPAGMRRLRIIVFDTTGATYSAGQIVSCRLKADPGTAQGIYAMPAENGVVSDPVGNEISSTAVGGEVTVTAPSFCCPQ